MRRRQIPLDDATRADSWLSNARRSGTQEVAPDLAYKRLAVVNVVFFGFPKAADRHWVLIDTGIPGSAAPILRAAERRFGPGSRPGAILMTHGHFDHRGALPELVMKWDVPVYAHVLELPYLNGTRPYPPPEPRVGGGLMARLSGLYPRGPINVRRWLRPLPEKEVPGMPEWVPVHTPGHTPGHVSFWRAADRSLIVGDAFITTDQESAYAVATQRPEMHGPPMYYTPDWQQSRESVRRLSALEPELVITGHGRAMRGSELRGALRLLARDFDRIAVPDQGRYIRAA